MIIYLALFIIDLYKSLKDVNRVYQGIDNLYITLYSFTLSSLYLIYSTLAFVLTVVITSFFKITTDYGIHFSKLIIATVNLSILLSFILIGIMFTLMYIQSKKEINKIKKYYGNW